MEIIIEKDPTLDVEVHTCDPDYDNPHRGVKEIHIWIGNDQCKLEKLAESLKIIKHKAETIKARVLAINQSQDKLYICMIAEKPVYAPDKAKEFVNLAVDHMVKLARKRRRNGKA